MRRVFLFGGMGLVGVVLALVIGAFCRLRHYGAAPQLAGAGHRGHRRSVRYGAGAAPSG